jgi:hypothetical protein
MVVKRKAASARKKRASLKKGAAPRKSARRSSIVGKVVRADIVRSELGLVSEYVSPVSSESIRRAARNYSKALTSLAKR